MTIDLSLDGTPLEFRLTDTLTVDTLLISCWINVLDWVLTTSFRLSLLFTFLFVFFALVLGLMSAAFDSSFFEDRTVAVFIMK